VCVTCVWAGVDNDWEQEKLEARKMLENAAESHTSGARFVGLRAVAPDSLACKRSARKLDYILPVTLLFTKTHRDKRLKRWLYIGFFLGIKMLDTKFAK